MTAQVVWFAMRPPLLIGVGLVISQLCDVLTTEATLSHGVVEANPVMHLAMVALGDGSWALPKLGIALAAGVYFATRPKVTVLGVVTLGVGIAAALANAAQLVAAS